MANKLSGPCSALLIALGLATLAPTSASADINRPGDHPIYRTQIDAHLVVQWDEEVFDEGLGAGMRAYFPVIDNGPIPSISNNLAIGTGIDLTFSDGNCGVDCDAWQFWIPLVVQWNFFFSQQFSIFPELGLALQYVNVDFDAPGDGLFGDADNDDIDIEFVLWVGGRYMFSKNMGVSLRLGRPSLLLGLTFLF